jgi:beta-galactosidase GanA
MVKKSIGSLMVLVGLLASALLVLAVPVAKTEPIQFGVSFSPAHATGIGLDWQETYQALLHDLGVKRLRLGAYWDQVEPADDQFEWSVLDYQLNEASKAGATVILTIGRKVQRWPECHEPAWIREETEAAKQQKILEMLPVVVERYRQHPALLMWQLENEPLLAFGVCPPADPNFLASEEAVVRAHDAEHPILITDSGELNWWLNASRYGDVLGATMYRTVFSGRLDRPFSYNYIFPAWAYRAKARYVGWLRGKDVIISELQGEPWGAKPFTEMTAAERQAVLSPERLAELRTFAVRTQLPVAYWWGAEYWYWEKTVNADAAYWETARGFFE